MFRVSVKLVPHQVTYGVVYDDETKDTADGGGEERDTQKKEGWWRSALKFEEDNATTTMLLLLLLMMLMMMTLVLKEKAKTQDSPSLSTVMATAFSIFVSFTTVTLSTSSGRTNLS